MKRILARYLSRYGEPSDEHVASAVNDVWQRIASEAEGAPAVLSVKLQPGRAWRFVGVLAAAAAIVLVVYLPMPRETDAPAIVESGDVSLAGDVLRTNSGAVIRLADGSRVEMRARSEFSVKRGGDGIRIHLRKGSLIVKAAPQGAGRLYVQTKDMTISVVGTVFLVNAEEEGSHVVVIEGEVLVQQGTKSTNLLPGEQLATNPQMEQLPLKDGLLWSPNAGTHVALLEQSVAAQAPPKRLEFETATLKRAPFKEVGMDIKCRGIDGVWSAAFQSGSPEAELVPLGRCTGTYSLGNLIRIAYDIPVRQRVSGGPSGEEFIFEAYQLEARADDPRTATLEQLRQMFKNFLVDRLKLKVRLETKEEQGYSLRAVESGVKFKETSEAEQPWFGSGLRLQPPCYWCLKGNFSMKQFAVALESFVLGESKPVVNGTGLTGIYDITLKLYRIEPIPGGAGARGAGGGAPNEFNPSLSKALEDQLGLRLERGKVQTEHLIVEHFERPPEN